jgi:hypothetical protein
LHVELHAEKLSSQSKVMIKAGEDPIPIKVLIKDRILGLMLAWREWLLFEMVRIDSLSFPNSIAFLIPTGIPEDDLGDHDNLSSESDFPIVCTTRRVLPMIPKPEEPEFPLMPDGRHLQSNVTAKPSVTKHKVTWRATDNVNPDSLEGDKLEENGRGRFTLNVEFVKDLRIGDSITVWAKARFAGWCNIVESVKVEVYWAV